MDGCTVCSGRWNSSRGRSIYKAKQAVQMVQIIGYFVAVTTRRLAVVHFSFSSDGLKPSRKPRQLPLMTLLRVFFSINSPLLKYVLKTYGGWNNKKCHIFTSLWYNSTVLVLQLCQVRRARYLHPLPRLDLGALRGWRGCTPRECRDHDSRENGSVTVPGRLPVSTLCVLCMSVEHQPRLEKWLLEF